MVTFCRNIEVFFFQTEEKNVLTRSVGTKIFILIMEVFSIVSLIREFVKSGSTVCTVIVVVCVYILVKVYSLLHIMEREVAITLCFQLCFAYYTTLEINCIRSVSVTNLVTGIVCLMLQRTVTLIGWCPVLDVSVTLDTVYIQPNCSIYSQVINELTTISAV